MILVKSGVRDFVESGQILQTEFNQWVENQKEKADSEVPAMPIVGSHGLGRYE